MGPNLNSAIHYHSASLRYFQEGEHHVNRFCACSVLLMVFEGVLRFSEDGVEQEVGAGEYYIQRAGCYQAGALVSDSPRYLYVHFDAEWSNGQSALAPRGCFDYGRLADLIARMDSASHLSLPYCEQLSVFLQILLSLRREQEEETLGGRMAAYMETHLQQIASLSDLCTVFHYSKNYVMRCFKAEYGVSPIAYLNELRLKRAMYLLETTSLPIAGIAEQCGYHEYPYFYKRFLRQTGLPPRLWRERVRQAPGLRAIQKEQD